MAHREISQNTGSLAAARMIDFVIYLMSVQSFITRFEQNVWNVVVDDKS